MGRGERTPAAIKTSEVGALARSSRAGSGEARGDGRDVARRAGDPGVDVAAGVDEEPQRLEVAAGGGEHERRAAAVRRAVELDAGDGEEERRRVAHALRRRGHERRDAVVVDDEGVRAARHEQLHDLDAARRRGLEERRALVVVPARDSNLRADVDARAVGRRGPASSAARRARDESDRFVHASAEATPVRPSSSVATFGRDVPDRRSSPARGGASPRRPRRARRAAPPWTRGRRRPRT